MFNVTPYSGAILQGTRATLATIVEIAADMFAFVALATRTVVAIDDTTAFASRANVIGHAISDRGSALISGSSMSIASLNIDARRTYPSAADFVMQATVGRDVPANEKARIIVGLTKYYGLDDQS